jgi:glycosyltransferase involved in cell wall biosynthesis
MRVCGAKVKVLLFANTDWYLYNFRRALAEDLRERGYEVLLASPQGRYAQELKNLGFDWREVPMHRRSLNILRELRVLLHLYRIVRDEQVQLIHGFTIKAAVYGGLLSRITSCASICAIAGLGYVFTSSDLQARLLRPGVKLLIRIASSGRRAHVVLQNFDDQRMFIASRVIGDASKVTVIRGSGVDCTRFQRTAQRRSGEPLRVILASRLLWEKGIADYVDAARAIQQQGRSVQFYLAGSPDEGNPGSIPSEVVEQWEAAGLVKWLGHVDDMPTLLSSMHVFALPSTYGEGVPRSLLEAGACGLALVTSLTPGCVEVVSHLETGLLVRPGNAASLADAIAQLDDSSELTHRLGAAAQTRIRAQFAEPVVLSQTARVYEHLIGKPCAAGTLSLPQSAGK